MNIPYNTDQFRKSTFENVKVGNFFKESPDGAWHLKTGRMTGLYQSNGVRGEPTFSSHEQVLVPVN